MSMSQCFDPPVTPQIVGEALFSALEMLVRCFKDTQRAPSQDVITYWLRKAVHTLVRCCFNSLSGAGGTVCFWQPRAQTLPPHPTHSKLFIISNRLMKPHFLSQQIVLVCVNACVCFDLCGCGSADLVVSLCLGSLVFLPCDVSDKWTGEEVLKLCGHFAD